MISVLMLMCMFVGCLFFVCLAFRIVVNGAVLTVLGVGLMIALCVGIIKRTGKSVRGMYGRT